MKPSVRNIAIFASGNGSNAENIINYLNLNQELGLKVGVVVTNKPEAGVIERAHRSGVPVEVMGRAMINDAAAMGRTLDRYDIDAIVLAGFLLMVPGFLLERFAGRIINIHPSLLPRHGGKGMYGRHVHQAVVDCGDTETGITIHHVSEVCDGGSVIFQASVAVTPLDTPADVERKVHELERMHFPRIVGELFGQR